jgi:two-component system sensor histidine kinase VanS
MKAEQQLHTDVLVSARLRLALSYAAFLVLAGFITLVGVYILLRYFPDYPLSHQIEMLMSGLIEKADYYVADDQVAANFRRPGTVGTRADILSALVAASVVILGALAVIGISGGWLLAGWILRPLQRINEAAQIAATGRLDHRIQLSGPNDEFRQLADTFDHMLDRLHDAFSTQERFAANASHELRTPLAVTATLLDVARANPEGQDYATLIERLRQTNARAIGITEALLRLSDANAIAMTFEPVDLAAIVQAAIDENAPEADLCTVLLETDLDAAPTFGDRALLEQLASNLLQNAIRHNLTPGWARVTTGVSGQDASVTLTIENDGTHHSEETAARLSEPFLRGAVRTSEPGKRRGYGLGLALVSRITTLHDGLLTIVPRAGGGLITTVTLPSSASRR